MTEKDKMLASELYLAADEELVAGRLKARRLARSYNATTETEDEQRREILSQWFGKHGEGISIEPPFHCDYGSNIFVGNIFVGNNFYANFGCILLDCARIEIGDNVLLAPNVQLYTAHHPTDPQIRLGGKELASPITIGHNVWLGGGVIVCPNVHIGDNTTIGAGSVVTKDIPANVIAVGNRF
jgi:maltose O-acetyltransferase